MGKITEELDALRQAQASRESEVLCRLIEGWEVLEAHGGEEHRVLLIQNEQGEKRILKQFSHHQNARMRAEREALNAAQERGIPKLYEIAEDDQYVYLLREYVEGVNLEAYRETHKPLPVAEVARIATELCRVLTCLHRRNIIHRDVKPQNVIITPEGNVYLIDFDISRKYTVGEAHDTEYLGTRDLAAPEQFGYGQTDARSDIYSLGVVVLFMCTGSYELSNIPLVPWALRGVVRRCTGFAPEKRYQSVGQLSRRLRGAVTRPRRLVWAAGITAALLALACVAGVFLWPKPRVFPTLVTLTDSAPVAFQEPLIAQCVRAQLGKAADAPVRYGELAGITELYIYGNYTDGKAHDPEYRGDSVYINGVRIDHGTIRSLADLLLMPKLRVLRLYRQPLSNVDALAPLSKLEELSLDESPNVADIAAIQGLPWLRTLDISDTAVRDLSPLAGCPRLRQINLERIPCKDFSVLSRYPYLEYLNVNEASPEAVMAAVAGKMIDYLWLDYSGLTDIQPFARAESVKQLHAKHNSIRSLAGIEALTTLEYVDVAYNPVEDLRPLLSLPRLKALRIDPSLANAWEAIASEANFQVEWEP